MKLKLLTAAAAILAVGMFAVPAQAGGSSYEGFYKFFDYDKEHGRHHKGHHHRHHKKEVEYEHPGPIVGGPYAGIPDNPCHSDCGSEPEVDHTHDIAVSEDHDRDGRHHGGHGGHGGGKGGHGAH